MEVNIGQKVWEIEINNPVQERTYRRKGIKINELEIIGISQFKICLNDDWFTTLDKEKDGVRKDRSLYRYLNDVTVSIRTNNHILDDGVFAKYYSTKKPSKTILNKMAAEISNEIKNKYGFLLNGASDEIWSIVRNFDLTQLKQP